MGTVAVVTHKLWYGVLYALCHPAAEICHLGEVRYTTRLVGGFY